MWDFLVLNPMINLLLWIYSVVGNNFGLAIILFTILMRLITHPLTVQQIRGSQAMQSLQSNEEWISIQKKYKDDRERLAQEQMALYKRLGINPFGACLPTLIQFPLIIGLYQAVTRVMAITPQHLADLYTHLYPFTNATALIPLNSKFLWMNLGQPERIYLFGLGIPLLTILVVITTFLQSKLMATPSANPNDQTAQMTQMMNIYMPIMMGMIAYSLASGLALYFVASNLIGIAQYAALGKVNWRNLLPGGSKPATPAESTPVIVKESKPGGSPNKSKRKS